jgi:hypothetical protein
VRTYRTVPTTIALEQAVSRHEVTREEWEQAGRRLAR